VLTAPRIFPSRAPAGGGTRRVPGREKIRKYQCAAQKCGNKSNCVDCSVGGPSFLAETQRSLLFRGRRAPRDGVFFTLTQPLESVTDVPEGWNLYSWRLNSWSNITGDRSRRISSCNNLGESCRQCCKRLMLRGGITPTHRAPTLRDYLARRWTGFSSRHACQGGPGVPRHGGTRPEGKSPMIWLVDCWHEWGQPGRG
jgi:hypothetical protein